MKWLSAGHCEPDYFFPVALGSLWELSRYLKESGKLVEIFIPERPSRKAARSLLAIRAAREARAKKVWLRQNLADFAMRNALPREATDLARKIGSWAWFLVRDMDAPIRIKNWRQDGLLGLVCPLAANVRRPSRF